MSTKALEKLMITIGLKDQTSKGIASVSKSLASMQARVDDGANSIKSGALGLVASGMGIKAFMGPVYEMQDALADVSSLGMTEDGLKALEKRALKFSMQYGESATDFVKSAYSIQSAIAGLTATEVAAFTEASNVLAKATKADASTMTSFMGTMHGIFADEAAAMGKAEWVQMVAGQTAEAIKIFKTSGTDMSAAFTSLGANAKAAGIDMTEQVAVLGQLQATMSGAEAGTKYRAFLSGVGKAQEQLGLSFTDSQGKMLPMLQILEKIKGKFGETLTVEQSDILKKAFGSDQASGMLKLLLNQTDALAGNIEHLGGLDGMKGAREMAETMVNPWEKFGATVDALRINLGNALLPTINDLLSKMSHGAKVLGSWMERLPNLTRMLGFVVLGALGLGAAMGAISIIMGVAKMGMAGFTLVLAVMKVALFAASVAMWLLTSPIGLIILAVIGLVAGISALIYYWDDMTAYFSEVDWAAIAGAALEMLMAYFKKVVYWLTIIPAYLAKGIAAVGEFLGIWDFFREMLGGVGWLQPLFKALGWVGEQISKFLGWAGVDVSASTESTETLESIAQVTTPDASLPSAADSIAEATEARGGAKIGTVQIHTQAPWRASDVENWAMLQGG